MKEKIKEWNCPLHGRLEEDEIVIYDKREFCGICAYDCFAQRVKEIKDG